MKTSIVLLCGMLFYIIGNSDAWSGNVCTRLVRRFHSYSYCSCWIWWWCSHRRYVRRTYYSTENYCCPGWRSSGNNRCNIPICSPGCQNGGTCVRPNTCDCPAGYTGDVCTGLAACSHLKPCYPGRCYGNNLCMCSDGFTGSSCLTLHDDEYKPLIEKSNATFAKYSYTKNVFMYQFMTDSTNMSETDFVWTNQEEFNIMNFDLDASIDTKYAFGHIPAVPRYIRNFKLGIVEAKVEVIHTKLSHGGEYEVNRQTFQCPQPSDRNPVSNDLLECRLNNGTNVYQVDSGDRYRLLFTVATGGYRELINTDNNWIYKTETYNSKSIVNTMEFKFDYDVPVHCSESSCSSGEKPMQLEKDITKNPIKPRWSGWTDKLSGVKRYAFEVWKLEYSLDYKGLREPDILADYNPVPENITEVLEDGSITFPVYEPTGPGVFSAILEIADRANNSRYVRRITIFDKTSEITTIDENRLYATSASNESDYVWQTIPRAGQTTLTLSWENHFINEVHEQGHFLAKVLDYEPRLSDNIRRVDYKKIETQFDDHEGTRTKAEIKNINSIIRFEIVHGQKSNTVPTVGWENVTQLRENATLVLTGITVNDGDSRQVWIRAHDVMGNTKIDSTTIYFDSSPPTIGLPKFDKNVEDGQFAFSSRVTIGAKDDHSGIVKVSFKFIVNRTGEIKNQKDFMIKPQESGSCDELKECYCIRDGRCFMIDTVLDIDNCWLKVPMERVEDEIYKLEIIIYNLAMLSRKTTYNLGRVDSYNGIQKYYSPSNISIQKTTDTSLSISWVQAPTCYERAGILIRLFRPDNSTRDFKVHKDATTFDLTGLSPTTNYWFQLYTKYGNDTNFVMSGSPGILQFQTAEASRGFPPGGVAGLSAGFIFIIIIIVVVLVFLGRTGRLQPAKAKMTQGIRTIRNTIRHRPGRGRADGFNNRAYSTQFDDDIYFYGQMDVKDENKMVISRKDISLESQLTVGRFATIYLAKYYDKKEAKTVVAKVIKDDQNEENILKMRAKINFYTEKVGHHKNVMDFLGYVEDDVRGPFMVLEYCEKGVLKDFLINSRSNVTVDLEERMFRLIYGICLGMDYLSSRKIVHRRLAARNILLDHLCEPKITGFGPSPDKDKEEEGEERIPLKWTAPECMKSTRRANELSDVFSFGVVMWEVFSLGETPYPGIQSRDVLSKQKQGYKMKKPEYSDEAFYKVMLKCWHYDPNKRAGFAELKNQLSSLFQEGPGEEYYYRSNDI